MKTLQRDKVSGEVEFAHTGFFLVSIISPLYRAAGFLPRRSVFIVFSSGERRVIDCLSLYIIRRAEDEETRRKNFPKNIFIPLKNV